MARRVRALDIWMNGRLVGRWERGAATDRLTYDESWMRLPEGRPLSLSLPFARGHAGRRTVPIRGEKVRAYFENLIPDNDRILRRMRDRYGARSTAAFDLLASIGRDCSGAVQLVPAGESPGDVHEIKGESLDEAGVAQVLRNVTYGGPWSGDDADAFRLSIAGAQEKTALLRHGGRWCIPNGATPSTHIFKLPLGLVGNIQADMSTSVEIEWLCMELVRELGLPAARTEIGLFEDQRALIVERFDRRLSGDGTWWQRLPQEDFCQATGLPPSKRYETDGGPGIATIMDLLRGSELGDADRNLFFKAQLTFWVMAATDGHAKNFSIHLLPGGGYRLTPLYDVLSTYPIQGKGPNRLDPHKARLAMAVQGKNRHYLLDGIHRWHWVSMAHRLGLEGVSGMIEDVIDRVPLAIDAVAQRLPETFPEAIFAAISKGMLDAIGRLANEPDKRQ